MSKMWSHDSALLLRVASPLFLYVLTTSLCVERAGASHVRKLHLLWVHVEIRGVGRPVAMDASQWLAELPSNPEAYAWWPIILYMFYLMSVVCDDYLLPAVDAISARFHIPDDVAGAVQTREV